MEKRGTEPIDRRFFISVMAIALVFCMAVSCIAILALNSSERYQLLCVSEDGYVTYKSDIAYKYQYHYEATEPYYTLWFHDHAGRYARDFKKSMGFNCVVNNLTQPLESNK